MKNLIGGALALFFLALAPASQAAVRVLATTADWGALTRELGGDRVDVYVATTAMQDVHRVEAKPSLVARARTANLLVANGAELEAGWLPVLLQESGNPRIQRGAPGFFEAASAVTLVEVPTKLDRAMGDIHPLGNPHLHLDPHNVATVAKALAAKLAAVDPAGADYYAARGADFGRRWSEAMTRWQAKAAPLRDVPVVVMHRDQAYLRAGSGSRSSPRSSRSRACRRAPATSGELVTKLAATPPKMILLKCVQRSEGGELAGEPRACARLSSLPYSVGGSAGREGPVRALRRHARQSAPERRNEPPVHRDQHPLARVDRGRPGRALARAARAAGVRARHRVHRPRDRAGRGARRDRGERFRPARRGLDRQAAAGAAALAGALLLTWTERKRPEAQEALIGILFVLASGAADPPARERSARRRQPQGPAVRPDPLGLEHAARPDRDPDRLSSPSCGSSGGAHRPHRLLPVVRRRW